MNKRVLRINSYILNIISLLLVFFTTGYLISIFITPSSSSWKFIGMMVMIFVALGIYAGVLPMLISGTGTLKYLKGKNNYKFCRNTNIIGIIMYCLAIYFMIWKNIFNFFDNSYVDFDIKILFSSIVFFICICPLLVNMIGLYTEKNKLTYKDVFHRFKFIIIGIIVVILVNIGYMIFRGIIVNGNKIAVTEDNVFSISDFKYQLESRNLLYNESPEDHIYISHNNLFAVDSSPHSIVSEQIYNLYPGRYGNISINSNKKYPMFMYDSHISFIKRIDKNNKSNNYWAGIEDAHNGEIFAAVYDTNIVNKYDKYRVVVSEKEDITIYNTQENCYIKGGGILETGDNSVLANLPITTDVYDNRCLKIKVVDRVDGNTLDKVAHELASQ